MKSFIGLAALAGLAGLASANIVITETYVGIDGEDGTQDWIEITNYGAAAVDTGTLRYDDENPTLGSSGLLDSLVLNPGESAVFLIGTGAPIDSVNFADAVSEFQAIWSYTGKIGLTNGGGNLGQGGDQANILDLGGAVLDSLTFTSLLFSNSATIEDGPDGLRISIAGQNGAYLSNGFFNDNNGFPGDTAVLAGSPGLVPAPASAALMALGGLVAARRRRA